MFLQPLNGLRGKNVGNWYIKDDNVEGVLKRAQIPIYIRQGFGDQRIGRMSGRYAGEGNAKQMGLHVTSRFFRKMEVLLHFVSEDKCDRRVPTLYGGGAANSINTSFYFLHDFIASINSVCWSMKTL